MISDRDIDRICGLTVHISGKRFEGGNIAVVIEALEKGLAAIRELEELNRPVELEPEMELEEEPEPVIVAAPVAPKGFFRRGL